ncbi:hypothetical protein K4L44_04455 [Halosquirtibacter laminarini]|uniref:Uncharacterized protein n=1 Tax=Halosquirtibacter laminarini TaxID=3374600 RepID=A0AC61NHE9_9BACT|nr:hypothetical protein K4L44_04455 [Prolixibacteraceae bacterium]
MGFSPIGDGWSGNRDQQLFTGNYNGDGHAIINLYINRPIEYYVGLFGETANGTIKNLAITNASIKGYNIAGILAGESSSKVQNCYTTGEVKGSSDVGGFIGVCYQAQNCYTTAKVLSDTGDGGYMGNIISKTFKKRYVNCFFLNYNKIKHNSNLNYGIPLTKMGLGVKSNYKGWTILEDKRLKEGAPPILRRIDETKEVVWVMHPYTIIACKIVVQAQDKNGGMSPVANASVKIGTTETKSNKDGYVSSPGITNSTNTIEVRASGYQLQSTQFFLTRESNVCYISLKKAFDGGTGEKEAPYQIQNLVQLRNLSINTWNWDKHFIQTADIDAEDTRNWNIEDGDQDPYTKEAPMGFSPIGDSRSGDRQHIRFSGSYNGAGFTIDKLYIFRPWESYVALFGYTTENSSITALGLTDANITGHYYSGIMAGLFNGKAENCFTTGKVDCRREFTGGFMGECQNATNCYTTASVKSIENDKSALAREG